MGITSTASQYFPASYENVSATYIFGFNCFSFAIRVICYIFLITLRKTSYYLFIYLLLNNKRGDCVIL